MKDLRTLSTTNIVARYIMVTKSIIKPYTVLRWKMMLMSITWYLIITYAKTERYAISMK